MVGSNFNGKPHLKRCLDSSLKTAYLHFNAVVVDNVSLELMSLNYPDVEVIKRSSSYGYAAGYNFAKDKIQTEYTALVNNDVLVDRSGLKYSWYTLKMRM